ncbi:hypothetical protein SBA2_180023 [Acidobacteriia bacterium SbA2]|nr:hypothetical protein SBA2_180023 [Acidobacteriia bacterium SbA2]
MSADRGQGSSARPAAVKELVLGWFNERNFKWPSEGRGFRVCVRTSLTCHSEESQATRNLALP